MTLPLTLALALVSLLGAFGLPAAEAAAPPAAVQASASGVTSDVLPTTQINTGGWVEDQVIVGDTVFAGGKFTSARPAGAAEGTNESARGNLLSYSISSGNLGSFAPVLNGVAHVLALSPDKSRLYVGGEFTTVDGVTHNRLVAFKTSDGTVDTSFNVNVGGPVYAVSATDSTVYVGGSFTAANGVNRGRFAAFRSSDGALLTRWTPKSGDFKVVKALLVAPGGNVVAGGQFGSIGNLASSTLTTAPGSASLDPTTGAPLTWNVNKVVKQYGENGGVLSLKTDGKTVFGAGFWFGGTDSNFEGAWAVDPADGAIKWLADCHGDTYDTTVANGVVYAASHQHDCSNIGSFPQQRPTQVEWRGNAYTADAAGDVLPNSFSPTKFSDYSAYQAPAVINWFPQFAQGPSSGYYAGQPTLTIESTDDYVVVGGQFPTVNGKAQQGLVRFGRSSIAPNTDGPRVYFSDPGSASTSVGAPTVKVVGSNTVRVTAAPWDRDDLVLTKVDLLRNDAVVKSWTDLTAPWWKTTVAYTDTDVTAGKQYSYKLRMTDSDGNTTTSSPASVTPSGTALAGSTYSNQVLADSPTNYWRLDDPSSGTAITDWAGSSDLVRAGGMTLGAAGAIAGDTGASVNATGSASAASNSAFVRAPQTFSVEAWFKTGSTSGGQVVGFGDVPTGSSYRHDRQVYLNAAGNLVYYLDQNGTSRSITSPKTYNNNAWHHVVATLSSGSGMVLYVDGAKAASWSSITSGRSFGGYWRVGADVLPGKTASTSSYLSGAIDDVAVYPSALSLAQVKDHFADSGRTAAAAPAAAFKSSCDSLVCSYDATDSTAAKAAAADPTIADYAWNFGDGTTAQAEAKVTHTYKTAGTFDVSLLVTNSLGEVSAAVETVAPVGNAVPVAKLTTKFSGKKIKVDAAKSSDSDGKIKKYRWDFGDGSTSTKKKTSHTYKGTGSYVVTLTVTDDDGATGTKASTLLTGGSSLASDAFQRTASGWGTAVKGGTWKTAGEAGFATDGQGRLSLGDAGDGGTATLSKVSTTKANVVGDVVIDKTGVDTGTTAAYVLRKRGDDDYRVKLVFGEDGKLFLVASSVVDGREKALKTVAVKTTYQPGDVLRLRATISSAKNARIKAKVWPVGTKEPSSQLSFKNNTKALNKAGAVGVWGYQAQGATNAPVQLSFDNLLVTSS